MKAVLLDYFLIIAFLLLLTYIFFKKIVGIKSSKDFFKAGGNLFWVWIAVSVLGTNIQIEYILASASNGFSHGLAMGSFEWIGAFVLIFVAIYIVPYFLRAGVHTLPEYLEYRYGRNLRLVFSFLFVSINLMMLMLILNSSATFLEKLFDIRREATIVTVAILGGIVIYFGGMKGKLRLDLIVISSFLISGLAILIFCFIETEGVKNFYDNADGRLEGIFAADDKNLPWTGVFSGLWVTSIFYFGFFPPIAQSFLASNSLSEAQKGLLFVSSLKLMLPFILIIPGIVGYELFADQITHPDFTLPIVIQNVAPVGVQGFILAGYIGTLFTTYNSFLNSTASILSLDVFSKVTVDSPPDHKQVLIFKKIIPLIVVVSMVFGAVFQPSDNIFRYSQMLINGSAPVIATVFLFAIFSRKTPSIAAYIVTILGYPVYFFIEKKFDLPSLNVSFWSFGLLATFMLLARVAVPLNKKAIIPEIGNIKFERNLAVIIWGIFILTMGASIYAILI
ncbi:sodium/solute symporter [Cytophagaceae bacterium ABcell3]|nr:sodium/solute symporter [Cytophagaceae bacterium ABcell3]